MTATDAVDNPSYFTIGSEQAASAVSEAPGPKGSGCAPTPALPPDPPPVPAPPQGPGGKPLLSLLKRRARREGSRLLQQQTQANGAGTGTGAGAGRRLGFRSLLRSMSASSTTIQQIAAGQPRPGDVAPPSPSLTSESMESLESPGPLSPSSNVLPAGLPAALPSPHDDGRYYNMGPPTGGASLRRHSIGTFVSSRRERDRDRDRDPGPRVPVRVPDIREEQPPPQPPPQPPQPGVGAAAGTGATSAVGSGGGVAAGAVAGADILLVWSGGGGGGGSAAGLWISYLQSCFQQICRKRQRPSFRTTGVKLEDADESAVTRAKLVVLVVCPALLAGPGGAGGRRLQECPWLPALPADRTLAMLLGVDPEHPGLLAALGPESEGCRRMVVRDQDAAFVGEFLAVAMDMLVRAWRGQSQGQAQGHAPAPGPGTTWGRRHAQAQGGKHAQPQGQPRAAFSLAPKKVKHGQNKLTVLLADPLQPGDVPEVLVERGCGSGPGDPVKLPVRRRNPYAVQVTVPDAMLDVSALLSVSVSVNGHPLGTRQVKSESRLRELDRILRANDNPFQFLCQTLGFGPSDRDALDNFLLSAFQRSVPPHFNLLHVPGYRPLQSPDEFPTLLHFAANFGLERLALCLLDGPGGEQAASVRNCDDLSPADLAGRAGFPRLAGTLQGYMQMSEFSNMYSILKSMTERTRGHSQPPEETYLTPRPASETYSVPPTPRPTPRPTLQPPTPTPAPCHYVDMQDSTLLYQNLPEGGCESTSGAPEPERDREVPAQVRAPDEGREREGSPPAAGPDTPDQDELLEIIHDFKNNVFKVGEVERLVETWRGRNDVHQSFKDKQEQLARLREQYERVQSNIESQSQGKPSPFERIKKLFTRGKTKDSRNSKEPKGCKASGSGERRESSGSAVVAPAGPPASTASATASTRPPSSLSRHSSCSSTWSARSSDGSQANQEYDVLPCPRPVPGLADALDAGDQPLPLDLHWQHPVSPGCPGVHQDQHLPEHEHYVIPGCVRPVQPVPVEALAALPPSPPPPPQPPGVDVDADPDRLDAHLGDLGHLGPDGFPVDSAGFSSYVNVDLPSAPPPLSALPHSTVDV